jgi:hypothetical protein
MQDGQDYSAPNPPELKWQVGEDKIKELEHRVTELEQDLEHYNLRRPRK